MRVALCLSGQLRCFKQTYSSIKEHLIDPLNADVYIATWNYLLPDERNYGDGTLAECCDLYRPVASEVENFDGVLQRLYANAAACQHAFDGVHVDRVLAMWHKIRRAFELTLAYGRYDLYVRCRFDLKFLTGIPNDEIDLALANNFIGIPNSRDYERLRNDQFAFGSFASMGRYVRIDESVQRLIDKGMKIHPEELLFQHLWHALLATLPSAIQYRVLRSHGEENPCL